MGRVRILTIVDMQNDFVEGGPMEVQGGLALVPIINELIESGDYDVLVATQDWHPSNHISFATTHGKEPHSKITIVDEESGVEQEMSLWPRHCVARTFGAALVRSLSKQQEYVFVQKGIEPTDEGYSGFAYLHKEAIDKACEHKETLTLDFVGIATDYCVFYTAKDTVEYVESINASKFVSVNVLLYACAAIDPSSVSALYEEVPAVRLKKVKL